jgi:glycosyltransferase involved in cell wall biosynthesis
MHVAFVCNEYPPGPHGGVGSLTQTIARRLVDADHEATVIGNYTGDAVAGGPVTDDDHGVTVIRLKSPPVPGLRPLAEQRQLWRRLRDVHGTRPIDVVDGPEPSFWAAPRSLPFPLLARMNGGHRFFAEAEGRPTAPVRSWVEARSLRRADDLVAVSAYTGERTAALVGLGDRPIAVIPNPVDADVFTPAGTPEPHTVAFFGALCEKKGVRQLLEAFPEVARRVPDARLLIAGRDRLDPETGGSYRAGLEAAVAPEVAGQVQFLGPMDHDEVHALIARAEVCALPSHMEALPVAWLEVLASGRPLVASSTGPGPEVVDDGESGLLVDPHDSTAIAAAVTRLLIDRALRERLAGFGRQQAVQRFSIDHLLGVNLEHYDRVIERWRDRRG